MVVIICASVCGSVVDVGYRSVVVEYPESSELQTFSKKIEMNWMSR